MSGLTRRALLSASALSAAALRAASPDKPAASSWKAPGLEIYSLRREMGQDLAGTLALIRKMGVTEVEVPGYYGLTAEEFGLALAKAGLRPTALVGQYDRLAKDLAGLQRDARTLGVQWVIFPWIPHDAALKADDVHRAAREMNAWANELARAELKFAYHPHGYEFQPTAQGTLFDLLMAETDPARVFYQMDTFWIAVPGQDCAQLLRRYSNRFRLMHLKDLRKGAATGDFTGHAPDIDSVAVGTGCLDWTAILRAALRAGVESYYIEDESPAAITQIPKSLEYLRALAL
jgi:sugar phosphate isomerase/epimerase